MNLKRLGAVVLIYFVTSVAWLILGAVNQSRSVETYERLGEGKWEDSSSERAGVQELWGQPQTQPAPLVYTTHVTKMARTDEKGRKVVQEVQERDPVIPASSKIEASIDLSPRRKGLLWYSTYKVRFSGDYTFQNEFSDKRKFFIKFLFPASQAIYDDVKLVANGKRLEPMGDLSQGVEGAVVLAPGQTATLHMSYNSQGLDTWTYKFAQDSPVANVKNFQAVVHTNCKDIDFPAGSISPTRKTPTPTGWDLEWKYKNLISGFNIGIAMPRKLNPGPFAARLSYFAPVSLLFFFAVIVIVSVIKDVRLHPMHYLFLAAAFFSFHLLFSYTVDHLATFYSFVVASVVSLLLVVTYLRLVTGWRFAVAQAGLWQFVFLVLFAYAFFFEGYTGLTITIGAILTLAVMMQITGRVDWEKKLSGRDG